MNDLSIDETWSDYSVLSHTSSAELETSAMDLYDLDICYPPLAPTDEQRTKIRIFVAENFSSLSSLISLATEMEQDDRKLGFARSSEACLDFTTSLLTDIISSTPTVPVFYSLMQRRTLLITLKNIHFNGLIGLTVLNHGGRCNGKDVTKCFHDPVTTRKPICNGEVSWRLKPEVATSAISRKMLGVSSGMETTIYNLITFTIWDMSVPKDEPPRTLFLPHRMIVIGNPKRDCKRARTISGYSPAPHNLIISYDNLVTGASKV